MKIAVLSGKGGTGKTFVSVNLSAAIEKATYVDCDVEAPNGTLFYKLQHKKVEDVSVKIPEFNKEQCIGCNQCVEFCNFNALAYVADQVMLFPEVCHSCGGCQLVCKSNAITECEKVVGSIECGDSQAIDVYSGTMNIGEVSGVPIIKAMLKKIENDNKGDSYLKPMIIDCPPGSGCMVMESIADANYCILVAEPTIFGAHNLEMVYELVQAYQKPLGVILNKCMDSDNPSEDFCVRNHIPVIGRIPFDSNISKKNSEGVIVVRENESYKQLFLNICQTINKEVGV